MNIEHALIADYAEVVNGKLYLMGGGWDTTHAAQVPATIRLAVAVGVRIDWGETNVEFPVLIAVEDDDGHEFVRIQGAVSTARPANSVPGSAQLAQIAANIPLTLPAFGGYRVHIGVGGNDAACEYNLPFRLAEA
jgi:hypothetical protein